MDEHVRKAPSLLDELEGMVRDIEVAESWDCTGDQMRCLDGNGCECVMRGCDRPDVEGDAVDFLRTHHATIAQNAEDSRKLKALIAMRDRWATDEREFLNRFGRHLPASVECLVERFDAAIQEGEG